jgi:hypothetical protein
VVHWGDLNIIRLPRERLSDSRFSTAMVEFYHFIFEHGLMDIPLVGGNFTWSNNRDTTSWFKIGKFVFSLDWDA